MKGQQTAAIVKKLCLSDGDRKHIFVRRQWLINPWSDCSSNRATIKKRLKHQICEVPPFTPIRGGEAINGGVSNQGWGLVNNIITIIIMIISSSRSSSSSSSSSRSSSGNIIYVITIIIII